MLKDNDLIIGPYKLIRELGRGSFGVVWLAERPNADPNHVALKLQLDPNIDLDALLIETTLWARASDHPNVLPFIEARSYDGQVIIVSEYAPDGSLFDWLRKHNGRAPSEKAAIDVTLKILAGLAHLHQRKIIHRDLKPANILMQGSTPRLGDFGLARVLVSSIHGTFNAGTHAYMAPEAFHRVRNEQTDIWSVGVILFELLMGSLPFSQNGVNSFTQSMESVATPLKGIVACALENDPAKRFRSADEMAESLRGCLKYLCLPEMDSELGKAVSDIFEAKPSPYGTQGLVRRYLKGSIYFISKKGTSTRYWPEIEDHTAFRLSDSRIGKWYESRGGTGSRLGFPLSNKGGAWDNTWNGERTISGQVQFFEGGNLYASNENFGAHAVLIEPIMEKFIEYEERGKKEGHEWTGGVLGFPVSDEQIVSSRSGEEGTMQRFSHGCVVAWSKGVWSVICGHYDLYQSIDEWAGELGFPLSDEIAYTSNVSQQNGVVQWFENGCLQWNFPKRKAHYLFGPIYTKWREENVKLGFALNSAFVIPGYLQQDFEGGRVLLRNDGAVFIDNS